MIICRFICYFRVPLSSKQPAHPPVPNLHIQGDTVLHYAVLKGQVENVEKLLNHGMRVQHQSIADGATPLHRAAQIGDTKIATLLLNHGADLNPTNYAGQTPLDVAIHLKHKEFVKFFKAKGARAIKSSTQLPNDSGPKANKNNQKKRRNRRRVNKDTKQSSSNKTSEMIGQQELQDHLVVESECSLKKPKTQQDEPQLILQDFNSITNTGEYSTMFEF